MLILLTWASLTFVAPPIVQFAPADCDSIRSEKQDTLSRKDSDLVRTRTSLQEKPNFRTSTPLNILFGPGIDQQQLEGTVDSLLKKNPMLKGPFLKELLIPSGPPASYPSSSGLELFNQQLEKDSKFTPFERMSLMAKRNAIYAPSDKSLKSQQLDIIGTMVWLQEVLK
jgi:hypothetical protein